MRKVSVFAALAAAVVGIAGANAGVIGPAQPLSSLLADLQNNPSIQVGDKLFHSFSYVTTGNDMPTAAAVNVIPYVDTFGNLGIRFQGAFQDTPGNGASDALITYTVDVLDPAFKISDAHIYGNPDVTGIGAMVVTETWLPDGGNAKIKVYDIKPGDTQLQDAVDFLPNTYSRLYVQKDILADAGPLFVGELPNFSRVTMSFVDQTFSQVPEPMTLSVLGLGAAGLLFRRRK